MTTYLLDIEALRGIPFTSAPGLSPVILTDQPGKEGPWVWSGADASGSIAFGYVDFQRVPAPGEKIAIDGVVFTFVTTPTSPPTEGQVEIDTDHSVVRNNFVTAVDGHSELAGRVRAEVSNTPNTRAKIISEVRGLTGGQIALFLFDPIGTGPLAKLSGELLGNAAFCARKTNPDRFYSETQYTNSGSTTVNTDAKVRVALGGMM